MNFNNRLKILVLPAIICLSSFGWGSIAHADNLEAVPQSWRLQDYTDGNVILYFTGSSCVQGQLILPASVPSDSKQRLWSIVMTAKVAARSVGVYYHNDSGNCIIDSFYIF